MSGPQQPRPNGWIAKIVVANALTWGIFAAILFGVAGTVVWWRGWALVAFFVGSSLAASFGLLRADPALLAERFKPPIQRAQPLADKIVLSALLAVFVAGVVLAPLDVFRLHLLPMVPPTLAWAGGALVLLGYWITYDAMCQNAFAAPVVKLQAERGQSVVDAGLYGAIRHPMYAGGTLYFLGMMLWLQSTAGVALTAAFLAVCVARIFEEERYLRRELPGYDAYAARVRYRLIPYVW